ncbi:MAG: hypothetical protein ABEK01_02090 [Candidatus Nanohaloarchaea archaeon]
MLELAFRIQHQVYDGGMALLVFLLEVLYLLSVLRAGELVPDRAPVDLRFPAVHVFGAAEHLIDFLCDFIPPVTVYSPNVLDPGGFAVERYVVGLDIETTCHSRCRRHLWVFSAEN